LKKKFYSQFPLESTKIAICSQIFQRKKMLGKVLGI